MARVKIEVSELEFDEEGNTLWVHSARGLTVLRVKATGAIRRHITQGISSHCDVVVAGDIDIFVATADQPKIETAPPCPNSPTEPSAPSIPPPSSVT